MILCFFHFTFVGCLEKEPRQRLSGRRCLDHPWIKVGSTNWAKRIFFLKKWAKKIVVVQKRAKRFSLLTHSVQIQEKRKGPSVLHRLETLKMRRLKLFWRLNIWALAKFYRFMARYRWRRAIRGVRMIVRVKNSFLGIPEGLWLLHYFLGCQVLRTLDCLLTSYMKSQKNVVRNQRFRHKCDCMCSFCFSAWFAKLKSEKLLFLDLDQLLTFLRRDLNIQIHPFCSQHVLIFRLLMKDQFDLSTLVSYETALWQDVHHKRSAKTEKWAGDIRRQSRYDRMVLHFRVWIHFNVFLSSTWTILSS